MKNTYRANKRALTCEKIRGYIREQGLRPGSKLPSQREMCALFGVSRQCIHDAVAILVREGTLYTRPRSGQYVGAWPFEVLTTSAASNLRRHQYPNFVVLSTQTLSQRKILPSGYLRQVMELSADAPVLELKRLRRREGAFMCLEYSYTPLDLFPDFLHTDFNRESIRKKFQELDLEPFVSRSIICISAPAAEDAALLGARGNVAVSSGIVWSQNRQRVIEYYRNYSDLRSIVYTLEAGRKEGG